jgi:DNA polymerase-3 subunit alpha
LNYTVFHSHSDLSLLDSCTNFKDYIDRAVELGQTAIGISEHGKPLQWVAKKMYCDEKKIKYIHCVECYLTESLKDQVRDNYHTVLIAKNFEGLLEINKAISKSCNKDHFYYVNRLTFDEFLNLSKNVITTSACLASPLNKLDINHPRYAELISRYDFLEIQAHEHKEQVTFNVHLASLSQTYNKPLIAGTDTHSLSKYKAECRKILLKRKHKSYGDEDQFDLTYKTYDELVEAFRAQNAIPENLYIEAIANTNKLADMVEDFELDKSLKYPILYGTREKDKEIFAQTIENKFNDKVKKGIISQEQIEAFKTALNEEQRVFNKIEMDGFMLSMSELISWCHKNDIPIGNARGSVGGSRVAYVTDIIDLNPETWHTVFSRFCNEDRKEVGDIDVDVIDTDRPKVFNYIVNRFGKEFTARVSSFGTIAEKGTIDDIGGALNQYWEEQHPGDKGKNPFSLANIEKVKRDFTANEEEARIKYPEIFYYYDGLLGTKISQSVHPAGMVISPITLLDHYGVFDKDGDTCLMLDMDEVHEIGLVKYDFLILKNIGIINDVYKMLGKRYPKSHEIDWNDQLVWTDMLKSPVGIFQMEGEYAHSLLRQYEPHSIFDMSLVTAAIRPSGASYRDKLMKHEVYKNPSPIIDELLKENYGFLIYQEDTIKFLQQICGLTGSEADNIRRAIGRKDEDRLNKSLPQILEGYCCKSNQPHEVAEKEAEQFLQIIKDSASYQFGYNHSIAYCLIGYMCAYLRYYYPYEFITTYLNNAANDDDITSGTDLASEYGIKIIPPKFGLSKDKYVFNCSEKVIAKGVSSIKYLNSSVANQLFNLSKEKYKSFTELLHSISENTDLDTRQRDILIKIDYFSEYGNAKELLRITDMYEYFKQGNIKTIKRDAINNGELESLIIKYSKIGEKSYTFTNDQLDSKAGIIKTLKKEYKKTPSDELLDKINKLEVIYQNEHKQHILNLIIECEKYIRSLNISDFDYKNKIQTQLELLGYINLVTNKEGDRRKLLVNDVRELKNKANGDTWGWAIFTTSIGTGKHGRLTVKDMIYSKKPIRKNDIIYASEINKNKSGFWYLIDYEQIA